MNPYVKAATRARLLGNLIRGHAALHHRQHTVLTAASRLHDASTALHDHADQTDDPLPAQAVAALYDASVSLAGSGYPPDLIRHVIAPVTGATPALPRLDLPPDLRHRLDDLRAQHMYVIEAGHLDSGDDQIVMAALSLLLDVHRAWDQLVHTAAHSPAHAA